MPLDDAGFGRRIEALEKIDKVIELLATEDRWCKRELISPDGRRCILGAVQAVDGTTVLLLPIRLAIRQVTGRNFHRIEAFNDHTSTSHALVVRVLHQARENIINGIEERSIRSASVSTKTSWSMAMQRLRAWLDTP